MVGLAKQRVGAPRSLATTSLPVVRYQHIDALFGDNVVGWELIKTHWQDLLRVVISIQKGKVLPSMLLRKLTTYMVMSSIN
jgi:TnpA family transposase